jgi:hypothetical protein
MNQKMAKLLAKANIDLSDEQQLNMQMVKHDFTEANGSVLLKNEYAHSRHIAAKYYQDKTGYECFVNHVHIPFKKGKKALLSSLGYLFSLGSL